MYGKRNLGRVSSEFSVESPRSGFGKTYREVVRLKGADERRRMGKEKSVEDLLKFGGIFRLADEHCLEFSVVERNVGDIFHNRRHFETADVERI